MKGYEYILAKQTQWALNNGIKLIGSKGERGRPAYTGTLDENLFEPLLLDVRKAINGGDGGELNGTADSPSKMQAIHSSSALAVNIFQYWEKIHKVPDIAAACGLCRKGSTKPQKIVFEDKYTIDQRFPFAPNIDVVIHNEDSAKVKRFEGQVTKFELDIFQFLFDLGWKSPGRRLFGRLLRIALIHSCLRAQPASLTRGKGRADSALSGGHRIPPRGFQRKTR